MPAPEPSCPWLCQATTARPLASTDRLDAVCASAVTVLSLNSAPKGVPAAENQRPKMSALPSCVLLQVISVRPLPSMASVDSDCTPVAVPGTVTAPPCATRAVS